MKISLRLVLLMVGLLKIVGCVAASVQPVVNPIALRWTLSAEQALHDPGDVYWGRVFGRADGLYANLMVPLVEDRYVSIAPLTGRVRWRTKLPGRFSEWFSVPTKAPLPVVAVSLPVGPVSTPQQRQQPLATGLCPLTGRVLWKSTIKAGTCQSVAFDKYLFVNMVRHHDGQLGEAEVGIGCIRITDGKTLWQRWLARPKIADDENTFLKILSANDNHCCVYSQAGAGRMLVLSTRSGKELLSLPVNNILGVAAWRNTVLTVSDKDIRLLESVKDGWQVSVLPLPFALSSYNEDVEDVVEGHVYIKGNISFVGGMTSDRRHHVRVVVDLARKKIRWAKVMDFPSQVFPEVSQMNHDQVVLLASNGDVLCRAYKLRSGRLAWSVRLGLRKHKNSGGHADQGTELARGYFVSEWSALETGCPFAATRLNEEYQVSVIDQGTGRILFRSYLRKQQLFEQYLKKLGLGVLNKQHLLHQGLPVRSPNGIFWSAPQFLFGVAIAVPAESCEQKRRSAGN